MVHYNTLHDITPTTHARHLQATRHSLCHDKTPCTVYAGALMNQESVERCGASYPSPVPYSRKTITLMFFPRAPPSPAHTHRERERERESEIERETEGKRKRERGGSEREIERESHLSEYSRIQCQCLQQAPAHTCQIGQWLSSKARV